MAVVDVRVAVAVAVIMLVAWHGVVGEKRIDYENDEDKGNVGNRTCSLDTTYNITSMYSTIQN